MVLNVYLVQPTTLEGVAPALVYAPRSPSLTPQPHLPDGLQHGSPAWPARPGGVALPTGAYNLHLSNIQLMAYSWSWISGLPSLPWWARIQSSLGPQDPTAHTSATPTLWPHVD